jgi:tRNA A-37 threonylcarbamoyl transferase component Bud32
MKTLEEILSKTVAYQDAVIQKIFNSKKHTVALVTLNGKARVIKWYQPGFSHNMNNEYRVLSTYSSKLTIPTVFEKNDTQHLLFLQYITGDNLCDLIHSSLVSREEKTRLMILLAQWYAQFHEVIKSDHQTYIHGDAHLRNFIFSDRIWGVDFEETIKGEPVQDIARLAASILTTNPSFTKEKLQLTQTFISSYQQARGCTLPTIDEELHIAVEEVKERRKELLLNKN